MTQIFERIVAALQSGNYSKVDIRKRSWFTENPAPITDEADLFDEASKTLLYLWCVTYNEERYRNYYDYVLVPNEDVIIPNDATFKSILEIISIDAIESLQK